MVLKKKEKNVLIVTVPFYFEFYFCTCYYLLSLHDDIIIKTKNCTGVLEHLKRCFTQGKGVGLACAKLVSEEYKDGYHTIKLSVVGAVR